MSVRRSGPFFTSVRAIRETGPSCSRTIRISSSSANVSAEPLIGRCTGDIRTSSRCLVAGGRMRRAGAGCVDCFDIVCERDVGRHMRAASRNIVRCEAFRCDRVFEAFVQSVANGLDQDLGDMTTGTERRSLSIMGQRPTDFVPSLDDGNPYWPSVTAIAESPKQRGVLYVGTDDGKVRVSRDGGRTWTDVQARMPGFPANSWVNGIETSRHADGRVYLVVNDYRDDDFGNYLWRSDDFGQTWTSITGDLPARRVLRTVREDPRRPGLLWLGAEIGLFVSVDGGRHWVELKNNMPTMAFNDLVIHGRDNDLVLGTHSRGVWILDNVNAIQELTPQVLAAPAHLFTIEPAHQVRYSGEIAHTGDMFFQGQNPPNGAIVDYWLGAAREGGAVAISVHNAAGQQVANVEPTRTAGINRVTWNLRHAPLASRAGARGRAPAGPLVVPGRYTVRLTVDGQNYERPVEVREDPRMSVAAEVRAGWTQALLGIADVHRRATAL